MTRLVLLILLAPLMLTGGLSACQFAPGTNDDHARIADRQQITSAPTIADRQEISPTPTVDSIAVVAAQADRSLQDGWYVGRDPRVFKSIYGTFNAREKAQFAMAFHKFLIDAKQDLTRDVDSYVPYAKRTAFAREYWMKEKPKEFSELNTKQQVVFVHESILDGNELWWRAYEKAGKGRVTSQEAIAHDVEQNMVTKYQERRGHEGSFSSQPQFGKEQVK